MIIILRQRVTCKIRVATLKVKVTAWPCGKIVSAPLLVFLKFDFTTISQKWSPYWDDMSCATFWSLPWRSRSQHDLALKSWQAHNFIIWDPILKLFHRNDHHIESPCREQYLGRYLEGQGHSMTLQQKRVRPITLLFEVGFYNYLTERIINSKKQELMIIKELFEGPVGDYCIARNTIKCLIMKEINAIFTFLIFTKVLRHVNNKDKYLKIRYSRHNNFYHCELNSIHYNVTVMIH